jgi:peptidoglycan/xylan/chitin deacetylase (PgdA/CDA1 family)
MTYDPPGGLAVGARPQALPWSPTPVVRASLWLHAGALAAVAAQPSWWPGALGAIAANHAVLACGMHPRGSMLGPNLAQLPPEAARLGLVALTFDDGPDPEVTRHVLDLLDAYGAGASFFAIGRRAERHGALVREVVRRGHGVENHTHHHPAGFAALPPRAMLREVAAAQRAIADACGREPRFFRAPMGIRSPLLDPVLAAAGGLSLVSWTRRGYDAVRTRPAAVLRRLTRRLSAGDILMLHDGRCARAPDGTPVVLAALPGLLARLEEAGLRAVSLTGALDAAARAAAAGGAGPAGGPASRSPAACASR